jgi:hypothetical protein
MLVIRISAGSDFLVGKALGGCGKTGGGVCEVGGAWCEVGTKLALYRGSRQMRSAVREFRFSRG